MSSETTPASGGVRGLVDHLFRHESGRIVASLVASFGPAHLDLAEEVMQEALVRALRTWPFHGVPERPGAWLQRVARNLALDRLRRDRSFRDREPEIRRRLLAEDWPPRSEARLPGEIDDDQLRLIFLCCHPDLPRDARIALTLKTVGGFSVEEIAGAFLTRKTTIAQRLVRAQRRIRERRIPFDIPPQAALAERLDTVLDVLYLMFNEGYSTHRGGRLIRPDLCFEALRLATHLARLDLIERPTVHALAALMAFQASRLPARIDADGNLVLLADQDHSRWNRRLLKQGFVHLERAASGERLSEYHLQAAIAAQHAAAVDGADTDWPEILELYNQLVALNPSPVIALNRAVALSRVAGPEAGLAALAEIDSHPAVGDYYLLEATRGELLLQSGDPEAAAASYRRALECTASDPERRFLEARLAGCTSPVRIDSIGHPPAE